jgi:hypothetical protein
VTVEALRRVPKGALTEEAERIAALRGAELALVVT